MKGKPAPIRDVVQRVFADLEKESRFSKEAIESAWKELVGETGFRHARPTALRLGVLSVRVDSSGWMQELSMRKRALLKGLKRVLGRDRISEIRLRIGELDG